MNKYLLIPFIFAFCIVKAQKLDTSEFKLLALNNQVSFFAEKNLIYSLSISAQKERDVWFHFNGLEEKWASKYTLASGLQQFDIIPEEESIQVFEATNGIDTIFYHLHFYKPYSKFSDSYIMENEGRVTFSHAQVVDIINKLGYEDLDNNGNISKLFSESYVLELSEQQLRPSDLYYRTLLLNPWSDNKIELLNKEIQQSKVNTQQIRLKGYYQKIVREVEQFTKVDTLWSWLKEMTPMQTFHINVLVSAQLNTGFINKVQSEKFKEWILVLPKNETILRKSR
ncbi:MAG: hypothetical protein AAFO07_30830, partial [Bacteroidota bacterium]